MTSSKTEPARKAETRYLPNRRPALGVGDYLIEVHQSFEEKRLETAGPLPNSITQTCIPADSQIADHHFFKVAGPRFALRSEAVKAVYPPNGAHGHFGRVLPHVVLTRSTLPWERSGSTNGDETPWLCLLTLSRSDEAYLRGGPAQTPMGTQVISLKAIGDAQDCHLLASPAPEDLAPPPNAAKDEEPMVQVLDIDIERARKLLPANTRQLSRLAFVRQSRVNVVDKSEAGDSEVAIVLGIQPPKPGETCSVHLVSVEGAYSNGQLLPDVPEEKAFLRLVSLRSWRFSCDAALPHSFETVAATVAKNADYLRLKVELGDDNPASPAVRAGAVPLHGARGADDGVAWYRGPLVPGISAQGTPDAPGTIKHAKDLMRFDERLGIYDCSYAAAWELGRQQAISDTSFMRAMQEWRAYQGHSQAMRSCEARGIATGHLPTDQDAWEPEFPTAWLTRISNLELVPFQYMIADERLLPPESQRFFRLDEKWLRYAMLGAASVGSFNAEVGDAKENPIHDLLPSAKSERSGFVLRSELLTSWPGLHVDGLSATGDMLKPVTRIQPTPSVVLLLFDEPIQSVEIALPAQVLHFELLPDPDTFPDGADAKTLRDAFAGKLDAKGDADAVPPVPHISSHHKRIDLP